MKTARTTLLAGLFVAATTTTIATAAEPLTVCLNKDNQPFSSIKDGKESGFDVAIARAVAKQLDRPLEIRWYQKERRSRVPVSLKTSVLLTAGVCDLVGGFPLVQSSLERPAGSDETMLPLVDGLPDEKRQNPVKGEPLLPSAPYHFAGVTPVLGPKVQGEVKSIDDLQPYRIGNRPASIGDLIAMAYKQGILLKNVSHVEARDEPFDALARGDFDVTLVEAHKFDTYRADNPQTPLRASGLMLPVGFNLGFVSIAQHAELLKAVDAAIRALISDGGMAQAAASVNLTWNAPQQPAVRTGLGLENFVK
jgi:ABC-type amino acid transport substrate-binding protein